jgi:hypothetical protein
MATEIKLKDKPTLEVVTTEKETGLSKKQLDRLLVIAYVGIVVGYGLLLMAKLKHSETK